MRQWFASLFACGVVAGVSSSVFAQVEIQVQAQPAPVQIQVQVQPAQAAALVAVRPSVGIGASRLAQADVVLVGRVVAFEPMDVEATPAAGQPKASYRIAVVQVTDPIFGLKKDTQMIRVGAVAQANNVPNVGGGVQIQPALQPPPPGIGRRPYPYYGSLNLQIGQEGLFTLNKHHKESFYTAPNATHFVNRENNANFDKEVATTKKLCKIMVNTTASLKAEDREDRYLAAALLINKYRAAFGLPAKQEPIDAEESKLILKALAEGDWKIGAFGGTVPHPMELFNQLGITPKDGYNPVNVRNQQDITQAMQKWLDENQGKYRINRLVANPNAKAQPPVVQPGVIRNVPIQIQPLPAPVPLPAPK